MGKGLVMKWEGASTQNICGTPREPFEKFTLFSLKRFACK